MFPCWAHALFMAAGRNTLLLLPDGGDLLHVLRTPWGWRRFLRHARRTSAKMAACSPWWTTTRPRQRRPRPRRPRDAATVRMRRPLSDDARRLAPRWSRAPPCSGFLGAYQTQPPRSARRPRITVPADQALLPQRPRRRPQRRRGSSHGTAAEGVAAAARGPLAIADAAADGAAATATEGAAVEVGANRRRLLSAASLRPFIRWAAPAPLMMSLLVLSTADGLRTRQAAGRAA